jgi:hypothetical protein
MGMYLSIYLYIYRSYVHRWVGCTACSRKWRPPDSRHATQPDRSRPRLVAWAIALQPSSMRHKRAWDVDPGCLGPAGNGVRWSQRVRNPFIVTIRSPWLLEMSPFLVITLCWLYPQDFHVTTKSSTKSCYSFIVADISSLVYPYPAHVFFLLIA